MKNFTLGFLLALSLVWLPSLLSSAQARDEAPNGIPIYPTWKLMNNEAKKQFVAGYVFGFRDARALGEIALEYVRSNPEEATAGLERLLSFYQLTKLSPTKLVPLLDDYFGKLENREHSLRIALNKLLQQ